MAQTIKVINFTADEINELLTYVKKQKAGGKLATQAYANDIMERIDKLVTKNNLTEDSTSVDVGGTN